MSGAIKISPQYGVNPSITKCFWCGEDMGVALFGKLKGDKKAPMYCFGGYEPCEKCKKSFAMGITFIGVSEKPPYGINGLPPIVKDGNIDMYPTGDIAVVTEECVRHVFVDESMAENVIEKKAAFLPSKFVRGIVGVHDKQLKEDNNNESNGIRLPTGGGEVTD